MSPSTKSTRWVIDWGGERYEPADLTIGQACTVEADLGMSWLMVSPTTRTKDARAVLAVMHSERAGVDKAALIAELGKLTAREFRQHFTLEDWDVDPPELPKAGQQWVISYGGRSYAQNDVTVDQADRVQDLVGVGWYGLHPLLRATHARAITALLHADATGRPFDEVFGDVGRMGAHEFVRGIRWVDDDIPGSFADGFPTGPTGARSTRSSSGSTGTRGTGRRTSPASKRSAT